MSLSKTGCESNPAFLLFVLCVITVYSASYSQAVHSDSNVNQSAHTTTENNTDKPLNDSNQNSGQDKGNDIAQDDTQASGDSSNASEQVFNIDVLIERMKETDAIGVISKLSLKNKVDDLLEQAQAIKSSTADTNDITEDKMALREKFEGLILKTVTLLNKGEDFSLAEDIYLAREELWKSIMENKA